MQRHNSEQPGGPGAPGRCLWPRLKRGRGRHPGWAGATAFGLVLGLLLAAPWAQANPLMAGQGAGATAGSGAALESPSPAVHMAGSYELAGVDILGMRVLTVASPVVGEDGSTVSARQRAEVIEGNLQLLYRNRGLCSGSEWLAEEFRERLLGRGERVCGANRQWGLLGDPDALTIAINETAPGQIVLEAVVPGRQDAMPLLSITEADASLNGTTPGQLAPVWRQRLERRLRLARTLLQPQHLIRRWLVLLLIEALLLALTIVVFRRWNRNRILIQSLRQQRQDVLEPQLEQRIQRRHNLGRLLLLGVVLGALVIEAVAVLAWPGFEPLALALLMQPAAALLKLLLILLVSGLCRGLAAFLLKQWAENVHVKPNECCRRDQRHRSLLRVSQRLIDLSAMVAAAIWILVDVPGVGRASTAVLLASGALLGALALVFQDLLRDFVAGLVALLEDHYTIGDWVEIEGEAGTVVDVGLTSTQLRCLDQRVAVFRNSAFHRMVNHTKLRSGSLVTVLLSHQCQDIDRALAVIRAVCRQFGEDPHWKGNFYEPPLVRGVQRITALGIHVQILLTTRAGRQWPSERELQRRLLEELNQEGIPLADGLEVVTQGR